MLFKSSIDLFHIYLLDFISSERSILRFVQFSCSVVSDSLQHHGLLHTKFPCPSPTPGACSNSCPSSQYDIQPFHPLSSSSSSFSFCQHQGLFQWVSPLIRWPKYWSFSFSISLLMNIQDWFPLGWTGWISLQSKELSRVFSNTTVQKH